MLDRLHVVWQGDGLPSPRLHNAGLHRVVMGVCYLLCREGARTVEVVTFFTVGQYDVAGHTIHHGVLVFPSHILRIAHVKQEIRIADCRLELRRWVPDDRSQIRTASQCIFPDTSHFPHVIAVCHCSRHLQRL